MRKVSYHGVDVAGNRNGKGARPPRVAVISVHTSPQDQPGWGDSGGMNVYIRSVARKLADQGIAVDIYTRAHGEPTPAVQDLGPQTRLIQVQAGPGVPVPKEDLPTLLPSFLDGVLAHAAADGDVRPHRHGPYDVVHSHYWLSGWVGARAKHIWGAPLVSSFHTLGKVKNRSVGSGETPEPSVRLEGEETVVRDSDVILAPTPAEAESLVGLYGADPSRVRLVAPGVDRSVFSPRSRREARGRLHLGNVRLVLFVGRLQPHKGPDVAIRAVARAVADDPATMRGVVLGVVGGPTGAVPEGDEVARLMELATSCGVADRVVFYPPQPHERLADFYAAAEAVLVPSRSESFGLVAVEAQASGAPVIAAAVGGLRYAVRDGVSGFLVPGHDPARYAERLLVLLRDPALGAAMSRAAVGHASRFSWDSTAAAIGRVYEELAERRGT
jgi:D-inositol-3-phosphate glycosyltransferase